MSTSFQHFVVLGKKFEFDKEKFTEEWYEKHEYYMDHRKVKPGDFCIIFDGMNSRYVVIGEVISVANSYEGLPITELEMPNDFIKALKALKMSEMMNEQISGNELKYIVFTHWF